MTTLTIRNTDFEFFAKVIPNLWNLERRHNHSKTNKVYDFFGTQTMWKEDGSVVYLEHLSDFRPLDGFPPFLWKARPRSGDSRDGPFRYVWTGTRGVLLRDWDTLLNRSHDYRVCSRLVREYIERASYKPVGKTPPLPPKEGDPVPENPIADIRAYYAEYQTCPSRDRSYWNYRAGYTALACGDREALMYLFDCFGHSKDMGYFFELFGLKAGKCFCDSQEKGGAK